MAGKSRRARVGAVLVGASSCSDQAVVKFPRFDVHVYVI